MGILISFRLSFFIKGYWALWVLPWDLGLRNQGRAEGYPTLHSKPLKSTPLNPKPSQGFQGLGFWVRQGDWDLGFRVEWAFTLALTSNHSERVTCVTPMSSYVHACISIIYTCTCAFPLMHAQIWIWRLGRWEFQRIWVVLLRPCDDACLGATLFCDNNLVS